MSALQFSTPYIGFDGEPGEPLSATIETERLRIESISLKDSDHYISLYGDPINVKKFGNGEPRTAEQMNKTINDVWIKRWQDHDPYSALAIYENESDDFVGHIVLGHGDHPGEAELAYLLKKDKWNQKFGTEAAYAIVHDYAPITAHLLYQLDGSLLQTIKATARIDNCGSVKILEKLKMKKVRKLPHERLLYEINIDTNSYPFYRG